MSQNKKKKERKTKKIYDEIFDEVGEAEMSCEASTEVKRFDGALPDRISNAVFVRSIEHCSVKERERKKKKN
jgi:hypothetical protein